MSTVAENEAVGTVTFHQALERAELLARQSLPTGLHERLSCAMGLIREGKVFQADDQAWLVASAGKPEHEYRINGHGCQCEDALYRSGGRCKHQLAVFLARKSLHLMQAEPVPVVPEVVEPWGDNDAEEPVPADPVPPAAPLPAAPHGIDARHVVWIRDKPFVRFAGLLAEAHQRGLTALKVEWTYNDAELSLAHAVAVFPFGTFEESGDATKDNVNTKVAPHFRRCALTRASARCLRLALGLDMVAVEELAGE